MTVFRERHIQTRFTGDLVAVHIFFVGILKRVGKRLSLAVGTGLPQPPWLGASLHHQAAGHDRPCAQPGRPLNRPSLAGELSGDYCQCTLGQSCLSHPIERLSEQELIATRISCSCFFVSAIEPFAKFGVGHEMGAECSCKITPSKGICTWLAMGFPGTTTLPDNKSRFLANFAKGSTIVYVNRMHARQRSYRMDVAHPER